MPAKPQYPSSLRHGADGHEDWRTPGRVVEPDLVDVDLMAGIAKPKTKNGDRRTLVFCPMLSLHSPVCIVRPEVPRVRQRVPAYQSPTSIDSAWRDAVERAKIRISPHYLVPIVVRPTAYLWLAFRLNVIAEVLASQTGHDASIQPLDHPNRCCAIVAALGHSREDCNRYANDYRASDLPLINPPNRGHVVTIVDE